MLCATAPECYDLYSWLSQSPLLCFPDFLEAQTKRCTPIAGRSHLRSCDLMAISDWLSEFSLKIGAFLECSQIIYTMPRRKTLRASSRRAKPEAPPGSVGEDLTGETKQEKLEVLLRDFDAEVELRVKEMKSYYEHLKSEVEKLYQFEMMKLPKAIQSMKMKDFLESGGSVNAAQLQQQHREVDELINSIKKRPLANSKAKAMPLQMETISEEKENQKMEAPKTRQRAPKTASRTAAASRRRVAAAALTTPAHTRGALTGWETPLQTPAFDPRLPQTPAVKTGQAGRKLKPGESIFLISANGSPISLDTNPVVFAPTKSGDRVQSICVLNGDDPRLLDKAGIKVG